MPCYDPSSEDIDRSEFRQADEDRRKLRDMLCRVCSILENPEALPRDIHWWWEDHKQKDADRLKAEAEEGMRKRLEAEEKAEREAKVKAIVAKLSPEDRAILGIKE